MLHLMLTPGETACKYVWAGNYCESPTIVFLLLLIVVAGIMLTHIKLRRPADVYRALVERRLLKCVHSY